VAALTQAFQKKVSSSFEEKTKSHTPSPTARSFTKPAAKDGANQAWVGVVEEDTNFARSKGMFEDTAVATKEKETRAREIEIAPPPPASFASPPPASAAAVSPEPAAPTMVSFPQDDGFSAFPDDEFANFAEQKHDDHPRRPTPFATEFVKLSAEKKKKKDRMEQQVEGSDEEGGGE
jgi:hypothetical protein